MVDDVGTEISFQNLAIAPAVAFAIIWACLADLCALADLERASVAHPTPMLPAVATPNVREMENALIWVSVNQQRISG